METGLCRPLEIHSKVEAKFHLDVIYRSPAGKNNYRKGFLFTEDMLRSAIEQSHTPPQMELSCTLTTSFPCPAAGNGDEQSADALRDMKSWQRGFGSKGLLGSASHGEVSFRQFLAGPVSIGAKPASKTTGKGSAHPGDTLLARPKLPKTAMRASWREKTGPGRHVRGPASRCSPWFTGPVPPSPCWWRWCSRPGAARSAGRRR